MESTNTNTNTSKEHEARIALYSKRFEEGLAIFTGGPIPAERSI